MHQVTLARRTTDQLRRTLLAIEAWLAENGVECKRLQVLGRDPETVVFQLSFACPLQARRFSKAFGCR